MKPLHIEVWSDFVCPFCYIGKRNLETALSRFPGRDGVSVTWKSFQLDPNPLRDPAKSLDQRLAEKYGRDLAWARGLTAHVTAVAKEAGLDYHMERAVPANTLAAHRLAHLAQSKGPETADRAEERLMAAYFTEGRNIGDADVLGALAVDIGLNAGEAGAALKSDAFADAVARDEAEARELGIRAVPFFLINREIPVSGAQPPEAFLAALTSAA